MGTFTRVEDDNRVSSYMRESVSCKPYAVVPRVSSCLSSRTTASESTSLSGASSVPVLCSWLREPVPTRCEIGRGYPHGCFWKLESKWER
jgi:hypothetical protein